MNDLSEIKWMHCRPDDYQALAESPFRLLPESLILETISFLPRNELSGLHRVSHLIRRISHDRSLIGKDVADFVPVIESLCKGKENKRNYSLHAKEIESGDEILPLKLLKLSALLKRLLQELSLGELAVWHPGGHEFKNSSRAAQSAFCQYEKVWQEKIEKELSDYGYLSMCHRFDDQAFVQCLEALKKRTWVQGVGLDSEISMQQIELFSQMMERREIAFDRLLILGNPPPSKNALHRLFQAAGACPSLGELKISMCSLLSPDVEALEAALSGRGAIHTLSLSGFALNDRGIRSLLALFAGSDSLNHLTLQGCCEEEIRILFQFLDEGQMKLLNLECSYLSVETVLVIMESLQKGKTVERIQLTVRDFYSRQALEMVREELKGNPYYRVELLENKRIVIVFQ
jgi:hypothetical protein